MKLLQAESAVGGIQPTGGAQAASGRIARKQAPAHKQGARPQAGRQQAPGPWPFADFLFFNFLILLLIF